MHSADLSSFQSDARISFYIEQQKFDDHTVTVTSKISRRYEDACVRQDKGSVVIRVQTKVATGDDVQCFEKIKIFEERKIKLHLVREGVLDGDLAFFGVTTVANSMKDAPRLRKLTLRNATAKTLACFKDFSQVKKLTIDNSLLKKSIKKIEQSDELSPEDIAPIDTENLCKILRTMTSLKRVYLRGCEHVRKEDVQERMGGVKVKIVTEPNEKTSKKKLQDEKASRDGKDEKEPCQALCAETASASESPHSAQSQQEKSSSEKRYDCYDLITTNYNKYSPNYELALNHCEEYLKLVNEDLESERDMRYYQIQTNVLYILCSCHFELGTVSEKTKEHLDAAEKLFGKFTEQNVKGKILLLRGDYFVATGAFEKAADAYRKAQKMKLDDYYLEAKNHYALGKCLQELQRQKAEIKAEFTQAYRLFSSKRYKDRQERLTEVETALQEIGITIARAKTGHIKFEELPLKAVG